MSFQYNYYFKMKGTLFAGLFVALSSAAKHGSKASHHHVEIQKVPPADIHELYVSSGKFKDAKKAEFGAIRDAQQTITTPTRSIDSLFLRLPSSEELDELILSADSVAILKTIQTVATDDSLPCDQRIAYLLELHGRIKCAIEKKKFAADQLEVIIEGAINEIKRLEDEIKRLQGEKKALWLDELRDKLAKLVKDLEDVYNRFNAVEAEIPPRQAQIAGLNKEIHILEKSSDAERNRIAQEKLKLSETQALIRELQGKIRAAKDRIAALEASIARSEDVIASNDKRIADARAAIRKLQKQIDHLQDKTDHLRAKATELEIKVERLRTDISIAEAKEDRINAEIDRNIDRINFEKKKIAQDELDDLNHMIDKLKELVPTTENEIDRHYYYCYGDGAVKVEKTGATIVYIVKGERFGSYIHSAYGKTVKVASRKSDVRLHRVDAYGADWGGKYGYPKTDGHYSFTCLNPSAAHKGYGKIDEVAGSTIYVNGHNGERVKLNVGACSRIESTYDLPKAGQDIYYSGVPSGAQGYNLYAASCV